MAFSLLRKIVNLAQKGQLLTVNNTIKLLSSMQKSSATWWVKVNFLKIDCLETYDRLETYSVSLLISFLIFKIGIEIVSAS